MISHGTLKIPKNELEHIEYKHMSKSLILSEFFNNVAIQVPNEINVCDYYNCKSNLIKTGNLIFSKLDNKNKKEYKKKILGDIDDETKIFIYPENTRLRQGMRFHVFETFDEFLSSISDLINAMNEIDNTHLVIRLHPGRQIKPEDFKLLIPLSNKLTITSFDYPFFKLLSIADILINFSSTVIEDALQNYIPVILYDKRARYKHIMSSQELNSNINPSLNAVYYMKNPSYVKEGLQWIIDNHLNKNISNSIFNRYVFKDNYHYNFLNFISNKTGEDIIE